MKRFVLVAFFGCAAAASGGGLFELHVEAAAGARAKRWELRGPGGQAEAIFLEFSTLLDESAIASAAAESGPDGSAQIRILLTPEAAGKFAQITGRYVGRRLGIVVDGKLRAAPVVLGVIADGVLVVAGNLTPPKAQQLAARLGPPPLAALAAPAAVEPDRTALRDLEGTWSVRSATMNGQHVGDQKLTLSTFTFREGELALTNGTGQTERFSLRPEPGSPPALHLEPVPPSKERGGWMVYAREGDLLTLVFYDNLEWHPVTLDPAPKKIVLELSRRGS